VVGVAELESSGDWSSGNQRVETTRVAAPRSNDIWYNNNFKVMTFGVATTVVAATVVAEIAVTTSRTMTILK